jgi:Fic family protein
MFKKIEKPNYIALATTSFESLEKEDWIKQFSNKEYLYWDKIKYKLIGSDEELKLKVWSIIKTYRKWKSISTNIKSENGHYFTYLETSYFKEFLHKMDLNTGGNFLGLENTFDNKKKYQFMYRGLMEEAIASAQLEGANTTRKVAKEFLRVGRKPKTESEHMILNTYQTMKAIENEYKHKKLNLSVLFELHEMITQNTIDKKDIGRFRRDNEEIVVQNPLTGEIFHTPPSIKFVNDEISKLINFANDELEEEFIHPIFKAIMLHFWIGHLHPFVDGNGRMARTLFYWYLLKHNYWAFAYLPISTVIKKSASQYSMAYVYSEQDDNDLTYFIDYNIRKIEQTINEFKKYIENKFKENSEEIKILQNKFLLNDRQTHLLKYLHNDLGVSTNVLTHMNINQITRKTAHRDLINLETRGFLISKKIGRNVYYYATEKVEKAFN